MRTLLAFLLLAAPPAWAEELPDVQSCLDAYVDRYEWLLDIHADTPIEEVEGGIWHVEDVSYCGTLGIVRCDRSDDPIACQIALADTQDEITAKVKEDLPAPADVAGDGWPKRLYEAAYALAHGSSAGPDCVGQPERFKVWCEANYASNRLRNAVHAWEVARYLGAAPSAIDAGWAGPPPPVMPRARPE